MLFALIAGTLAFISSSFAEQDLLDFLGGLGEENQAMEEEEGSTATAIRGDPVPGGLDEENQTMEEEEVSTATAIRGLNPVAEKYGTNHGNLSQYIRDVKTMEKRRISGRELRKFLMDEGLGPKRLR